MGNKRKQTEYETEEDNMSLACQDIDGQIVFVLPSLQCVYCASLRVSVWACVSGLLSISSELSQFCLLSELFFDRPPSRMPVVRAMNKCCYSHERILFDSVIVWFCPNTCFALLFAKPVKFLSDWIYWMQTFSISTLDWWWGKWQWVEVGLFMQISLFFFRLFFVPVWIVLAKRMVTENSTASQKLSH